MTKNVNIAKILDQDDIFAASITVGNSTVNVLANSTILKLANSTVNTSIKVPTTVEYAGSYYLHANGTWQLVAAGATPGGANTQVQFNDSTALGGSAGFTFDKVTNNVVIANTLTVGTSTVNSTLSQQSAINVTNQINTATLFVTTSANVGANVQLSTVRLLIGNTVANLNGNSILISLANSTSTANLSPNALTIGSRVVNSTAVDAGILTAGNTTVTGFVNASVSVNSALVTVGTAFIANTLGAYHTGTMNAAIHSTTGVVINATAVTPTSNTILLGNSIGRFVISANSADIGPNFIANSLGAYHTGTMNAASHTTTGFLANATHVVPTSNSSGQTFGNTISRWVMTANSLTVSGGVSPDSNTLGTALGTTTQRWVLTANSADIGPNFVANSLGAYHTAVMNAASHTTTGVTANVTGVYPTSNSSGQNLGLTTARWVLFANTIDITSTLTANGALGTGSQILTSNSLGGVYWASPSGGGNVTKVGTPVDDQVAVWTGDGTIEGTTGFTFSAASNNAVVANTLTVGTATVNSTLAVLSALNVTNQVNTATLLSTGLANLNSLNVTNQTNTATLFVTTSANVGTAVLANSIGLTTTGFVNAATVVNSASHTIGTTLIANTLGVYHTGIMNAASHTTTGFLANATHVVPTSNSSGQTFGNTISRWVITANSVTTSGGVSPDSNTLGTALGTTTQRWVLLANTVESTGLANLSALNVVNQTNTATLFVTTSANVGTAVLANSIGLTTTGFVNAVTVVNSASHTIGTTMIANTLGVYHTGIMNAASHTTTGFLANATHVVPTSNSSGQTFGNTISRWVITANSVTTSGGASPDSNTLGTALGTATQRWILIANTIESTGLANLSALNVVNQTNTATLLSTGLANLNALNVTNQINTATFFATTSANVGANVQANTTALFVGNSTVNTIITAGQVLINTANVQPAIYEYQHMAYGGI